MSDVKALQFVVELERQRVAAIESVRGLRKERAELLTQRKEMETEIADLREANQNLHETCQSFRRMLKEGAR